MNPGTGTAAQLAGLRVLATAATRGIGWATAQRLHEEGAALALAGHDPASLRAAVEGLGGGAPVHPVLLDVADAGSIARGAEEAKACLGGVDAVFLNVPGAAAGRAMDLADDAWQAAYALHVLSVLRVVRALRADLAAASPGRVVLITSYSAREPIDGLSLSNVVRPAVHALVRELARELGPEGILVNAIAPGRIETERVRQVEAHAASARGVTAAQVRAEVERAIPLGRYGAPGELARVAAFLLSRENTYVTGQCLLVDGGLVRGG